MADRKRSAVLCTADLFLRDPLRVSACGKLQTGGDFLPDDAAEFQLVTPSHYFAVWCQRCKQARTWLRGTSFAPAAVAGLLDTARRPLAAQPVGS